jgi:hypothetical protein
MCFSLGIQVYGFSPLGSPSYIELGMYMMVWVRGEDYSWMIVMMIMVMIIDDNNDNDNDDNNDKGFKSNDILLMIRHGYGWGGRFTH